MLKISKKFKAFVEKETGFSVTVSGEYINFQKFSSAGQDFNVELDVSDTESYAELAKDVWDYYDTYDPSYEAWLWIGDDGHGKNGAPHEMGDVYNDMLECEESIKELYGAITTFADEYNSRYLRGKENARRDAQFWQNSFGEKSHSYAELAEVQNYFTRLGRKYGLTTEFRENGII